MLETRPESPAIELDFELQREDIERGLAALPRARAARAVSIAAMLAVIGLVAYRWQEGRDRQALLVVGVVLLGLIFLGRDPSKRVARRVHESLAPEARKLHMKIDAAGLSAGTGDGVSELPWSDVQRVIETPHTVLVFATASDAQILPKRAMNGEQLALLRALVASNVTPKRAPIFTRQVVRRLVLWLLMLVGLGLALKSLR